MLMQVNIENKIFFKNTKSYIKSLKNAITKKNNIVFSLYLQYEHNAIFIV
jgi:hypothetical protein